MGFKASAAAAAILWGLTYIVTTTLLPHNPLLIAAVRALGGAGALLLFARHLPPRRWWDKLIVLGTLNGGLFFALLCIASLRLQGGVAAIFQALGPLFIILLGWAVLGNRPGLLKIAAVLIGAAGVALVVLNGNANMDVWGIAAALGATVSLALGAVLMNKWGKPPIPLLAFTGWQLLVAGIELTLAALLVGDLPSTLSVLNIAGFTALALLLTALPFALWFRAIGSAGAVVVAPFILLVPLTAFVLDALVKGLVPSGIQMFGAAIVMAGLLLSQWTPRASPPAKHPVRA